MKWNHQNICRVCVRRLSRFYVFPDTVIMIGLFHDTSLITYTLWSWTISELSYKLNIIYHIIKILLTETWLPVYKFYSSLRRKPEVFSEFYRLQQKWFKHLLMYKSSKSRCKTCDSQEMYCDAKLAMWNTK